MIITGIRVSKTIQTAQYEPETFEAQATLEEGDKFEKCAKELRSQVSSILGRTNGTTTTTTESTKGSAESKEKAPKDSKKSSGTGKKEAPKKAAKSKKKNVAYNREVKAHQTELGKFLHANFPGWKDDDDMKASAKEASSSLTGTDFMDGEGTILDSFVDALKEAMGGDEL